MHEDTTRLVVVRIVRILALLQRKTLIETTNRTLKCLKWNYSTVRSMKNVAVLTEDGAFALFFRPHPGGFDSLKVPTPGTIYHTDLGQNTVFYNFSRQITLGQCSGRSIVDFSETVQKLSKIIHKATRFSFLVRAVSVVACLNELL